MKRKSVHTLLCLAAAASMLTACSTADDTTAQQTPQATTVSFSGNASVEGATEATTRGGFQDAAVSSALGAYTWETGDIIKAAVYDKTNNSFIPSGSDYFWAATATPNQDPTSASVYWTKDLTGFDASSSNSYSQILFSIPDETTAIPTYDQTNLLTVTYNCPADYTDAIANSLDHLKKYSFIYAQQDNFTGVKPTADLQFNYVPALLRFAIANGNSSTVKIKSIKMECSSPFYPTKMSYGIDNYTYTWTGLDNTQSSISVTLGTATEVASGTSIRLYAAMLPRIGFYSDVTFTFTITTEDGNTYTSNKISGAQLAADWKTTNVGTGTDTATDLFREGKSYTFKLWLDNKKGLSFVSSSAMPGWGTDTDL